MQLLLRTLLRKKSGDVVARDKVVECPQARIGRDAGAELYLQDPRVHLQHAVIVHQPGGLFVETQGEAELLVNGSPLAQAQLQPGDVLEIGPYELTVLEGVDGADAGISVELLRPLESDQTSIMRATRINVERIGFSKRGFAWMVFMAVLVVALILPIAGRVQDPQADVAALRAGEKPDHGMLAGMDRLWMSGPLSGAHGFLGEECGVCHVKAFEPVQAEACMSCHDGAHEHADPERFPFASLSDRNCQQCHKQHEGDEGMILMGESFCVDCHADIASKSGGESELQPVSGFENHPPFRPSVLVDPASGETLRVDPAASDIRQQSGLKFPHDRHLYAVRDPVRGEVDLECTDCHQPDRREVAMSMPNFEEHCHSCHALDFDPKLDREMPHGKPKEAKQLIRDAYAFVALEGGYFDPDDRSAPPAVRRRPGTPVRTTAQRKEILSWAGRKADEVLTGPFTRGRCGECHNIVDNPEDPTDWTVAPVRITERWLPRGEYEHGPHLDLECTACHTAEESSDAGDVMLPVIEDCQFCHGSEGRVGKVESACVDCHDFHRERHGLSAMGQVHPRLRSGAAAEAVQEQPAAAPATADDAEADASTAAE